MFRAVIAERIPLAIAGRTMEEQLNKEDTVFFFRCEMSLSTKRDKIFPSSEVGLNAYDFSSSY